jgi:hypothetical protein
MRRPVSPNKWLGKGWKITVTETEITIAQASGSISIPGTEASRLEVRRRWLQWSLHDDGQSRTRLRGMTKSEASALTRALQRLALIPAIADATAWHAAVTHHLAVACTGQPWIPVGPESRKPTGLAGPTLQPACLSVERSICCARW